MGQLYKGLEMHGAETHLVTKLRGDAQLIKDHLETANRTGGRYSLNTLGIARQITPQLDKDNLKGSSFFFIANVWVGGWVVVVVGGPDRSDLAMLGNLQACRNVAQRIIGEWADCSSSVCQPSKSQSGKISICETPTGRMIVKTDTNPSHSRATLARLATFLTTRTIQTTTDAKPLLGN